MKILYFSPSPSLNLAAATGYATHMRGMIGAFRALGHDVETCIAGGTELIAHQTNAPAGKNVLKSMTPGLIWESLKDIRKLQSNKQNKTLISKAIKSYQPDLIYERASHLQTCGVRQAGASGIRHILEVNAPFTKEKVLLEGHTLLIKRSMADERFMYTNTDVISVVSSALKEYIIAQFDIDPAKIIVLPNAINPEQFQENAEETALMRHSTGFSKENIIVGFVGSILPWHGVDVLISCFEELLSEYPGLRLLIVGDGLDHLDNASTMKSLIAAGKMVSTGRVESGQVCPYIDIMDIAVMPRSNWYGSPVKIFEYGAMGKPVIAPDNAAVRDVLENEKNALLIDETPDSLNRALKQLIDDAALRKRLATNIRETILTNHTWVQNAEKLLTFASGVA